MKIFAINIVTSTKSKELYDRVSVNDYPIVICCENLKRLKEILAGSKFVTHIKNEVKTAELYNIAYYYIREFEGGDITLKLSDLTKIKY